MRDGQFPVSQSASSAGRSERFIATAACWPITAPSLILLASTLIPQTRSVPLSLGTLIVYGLFAFAVAGSLRVVAGRLTPAVLGIAFTLLLAFAILIILDPKWGDYDVSVAVQSIGLAAPWLLIANAVHNHPQFLRYLYVAAIVIILAGAVRVYFPTPGIGNVGYSQYAGYQMLPAVVILADAFLHRPRFRSGVLLAVAFVLLIAAGARGPLLAVMLYLVARAAVAVRRRPLFVAALVAAGLVFARLFHVILVTLLTALARIFALQGFSTRDIDRLIAGDFLEDHTRTALADHSWDLILQHPATGIGLARDRPLLARAMGEHDPEMVRGWYPHNVFLELLVQWGVFIGGALIVALAVVILRAVLQNDDGPSQRVVLIFVGIGLWPLLVSGSYLTSPLFFALLGFCLVSRQRATLAERQQARIVSAAS